MKVPNSAHKRLIDVVANALIDMSLARWTFQATCPNQGCRACLYDQDLLEDKAMRKSTEVGTRPA